MGESDLLQTFAEVGVALTGFTGIVVVLARRPGGTWLVVELAQLHDLLWSSLNVVFFALLPLVLIQAVSLEATWRIAAGGFALSGLCAGIKYWRSTRLYDRNVRLPIWSARLSYFLAPVGAGIIGAKFAVAIGFWPDNAAFVYLGALLWSLSIAVINFIFLLLPTREGAA